MHDLDLTPEEMLEVFGDHDPIAHAAEVATRWGDTDAHGQSAARTRRYAKADWARIRAESGAIEARLADALRAGVPADAREAMDAAEAHRAHLTRWFYDCSPDTHLALGEMYVQAPRFAAHYEAREPGLAAYVAAAIQANAAQQRVSG